METLTFTVDSKLLRELGERLVGRPHIALAELVKNSYDADASEVVIRFLRDRIEVEDDGHGMTYEDIRMKWLRIGSTHKEREEVSPSLGRALTGSKGVGRLAVQLLANHLEIRSVGGRQPGREVVVNVDWGKAINAGDLTRAPVVADEIEPKTTFLETSLTGTKLILTQLQNSWSAYEFEELARELWPLQSPFNDDLQPGTASFRITLESPNKEVVRRFDDQMQAVLDLWIARLQGELLPLDTPPSKPPVKVIRTYAGDDVPDTDHGDEWDTAADFSSTISQENAPDRIVRLSLQRHGEQPEIIFYKLQNCHVDQLRFEIRVFNLQYRQPRGIKVNEARAYLRKFGGVHIYDTGFHLPYYGSDTDWLHIEIDHSHRLSKSRLLPPELQRPDGMSNLPTNSRLFGTVNVNTAHEQRALQARGGNLVDALAIQVSRDRLTETSAYRDLVTLVRWAVDYYAMNATRRALERKARTPRPKEKPSTQIKNLKKTIEEHKDDLPSDTFDEISEEVDRALHASQAQEDRYESYLGVLGALATAGISALAYEHEVSKQFEALEEVAKKLEDASKAADSTILPLDETAKKLRQWIERAHNTHALFAYLMQPTNRDMKARFRAKGTIDQIKDQISFLNPGVDIDSSAVPENLRFPSGRYAEWSAIFQNIFINAFNAMKRSATRRLDISGGSDSTGSWLLIQDTGVGVNLDTADRLFQPFVRDLEPDDTSESLALGGGGLGLTIVRMTADELECDVEFVSPDSKHSTAVQVSWKD